MPVISLPPKTAEARRKRCSRGLAHLQESSPEVREWWTGWDSGFCQDFLKHKPPMHASCRVTTWEPVTVRENHIDKEVFLLKRPWEPQHASLAS